MTESEWLEGTGPTPMLELLRGKATQRKLRLFAVACCRRIWDYMLDGRSREAVEVSERYADGLAHRENLDQAWQAAMAAARILGHPPARAAASVAATGDPSTTTSSDAARAAGLSGTPAWEVTGTAEFRAERAVQADLLRDLFGTLAFRTLPPLSPSLLAWNDGLVVRMANTAYEERSLPLGELDAVLLAVLCDALLDAGCPPDHELLLHMRGPGPHVRGCAAVDLLTGRS
jgi:hypothetical protein